MTAVFLLSRKNVILILLKINDKIYFVAYKVMSVTFWEKATRLCIEERNTFAIMLDNYFILQILRDKLFLICV